MDESWITVAQYDLSERDGHKVDLFMTSVLAQTNSPKDLLTDSRWLAGNDFGGVEVGADGDYVEVQTEDHVGKNGDVRIEPFTFLRLWYDMWPDVFEVIQNFILFYNLHFDASGSKYVAVNAAGETTDVIKIKNEESHQKIEIRTKYLRNYLACRERVLVRQHDNRIYFDKTLADLGIESFVERRLHDSNHAFDLTVFDRDWMDGKPAISRLLGKDLVRPFDKCQDLLGWPKGDSEFIIGVDEHGENVMATHNEGDGPSVFLTPVYFKREVLKKYYDSTKYKVEPTHLSCGALWGIPIDTNKTDLVQVYLGDLARLPANEQLYWQSHNVSPEGGITKERYDRDFNALFVDPADVVYHLRESVRNFQERFEKRFGFKLFLPLHQEDAHKEDNVRVPLSNDPDEFERQFNYLAVWLSDSIDEGGLREYVGTGCEKVEKGHSISVLEVFLERESLPTDVIPLLRQIQNLRSGTDAHRKGHNHERNVKRYGLNKDDRKEIVRKLLADLTKTLNDLA